MPSTYSSLKIQLMATGENNTTWGDIANLNLGTAIEEAITGSASVSFTGSDVTLTLVDSNASQTARNLRLNLTGTSSGARNLVVPSIEKAYIVNNGLADTVTVKTAAGSGVAIPSGKTMWVFSDGVNVVAVVSHLTSLTLGSPLAVSSGGTGATDAATARANLGAGTVTSVGVSGGATGLTFSGSPVTTSGSVTMGGTLAISSGGTGGTTASAARANLGATTTGVSFFTATDPNAITFPRINADNSLSLLSAADFRTALGTGTGTVTSVSGTGSVNGLTLTGTVTSSGSLMLGGSVTSVAATATVNGFVIGYRSIPRSTTATTATTGDVGKCIAVTAGITIPNATFAAGDAVSIYNDSAASVTITQGASLTLRQAGTTNTGNRTLAARGMATIWFNSASEAVISGAGVS